MIFFQAWSLELALFHVPKCNRTAIHLSGSVVSRLNRAALPTRKTFFDDLRALTRYRLFPNWDA